MKRFKAICIGVILSLMVTTLLAGCGAEKSSETGNPPGRPDQSAVGDPFGGPGLPPDGEMKGEFGDEQMPTMPGFPMGGNDMAGNNMPGNNIPGNNMDRGNVDTTIDPLPEVDVDEIFSDRDLEGNPDLSEAIWIPAQDNSNYVISSEGIYILSGTYENFSVIVEADKKDKVQIVLDGASVSNDDFPVIYVKSADKCFVTSLGDNHLSVKGEFVSDGDTNTDAVIFSKDDLTLNGTGTLTILSAAGNGITSKDDLKITGGSYYLTSAMDTLEANDSISIYQGEFIIETNQDGLHCENEDAEGDIYIYDGSFTINAQDDGLHATGMLIIDGGDLNITAVEGMEATYVQINGGIIRIYATDDGINASEKSDAYDVVIEINGGEITVEVGPGDTDCLDANGTIIVNGGTIDLSGNSTFDADLGSVYNGGTIIINGTVVDSIPESMMGGPGGRPGRH